jgi:DNA-directed RNA polymerase subunit beta
MLADYAIIHNTLQKDPTNSEKEAVEHIYRQLRNAEPPDEETARGIIDKLFFSDQRYNLGEVGRYRMNKKLIRYSNGKASLDQRRYHYHCKIFD